MTRPTYLVIVRPDLIAQDIALTISDHVPDANVLIAPTVDRAVQALAGVEEIAVAFLAMDPARYAQSELAHQIRARGGKVVLLGDEAEAAGRGPDWVALFRPFSTEHLLRFILPET